MTEDVVLKENIEPAAIAFLEQDWGTAFSLWLKASTPETKIMHGIDVINISFQILNMTQNSAQIKPEWIDLNDQIKWLMNRRAPEGFYAKKETSSLNSKISALIFEMYIKLYELKYIKLTMAEERVKVKGGASEIGHRAIKQSFQFLPGEGENHG